MKMEENSHVFYRVMNKDFPVAIKAKGLFIQDRAGKKYIDASGGPLVVNLGHGRQELAKAAYDQILNCGYTHPTMFTSQPVEELSAMLASHSPGGINRFYFLSGGAEAIEASIKLARQIQIENGRIGRTRLISRWNSYHGLSIGALSATGRKSFRDPFLPLLPETIHIPAPFCFRCPYGLTYPSCDLRCASALEDAICKAGEDTISAFLMETISGASIAGVVPPEGYLPAIREICDRYNVLLILDEILCGLGRCGRWFASEYFDVEPDIVTMGKGLGGGAIAISALGVQERHYQTISQGSGSFVHGGTFSHHNVAAAIGKTVIGILEKENLVEQSERKGNILGNLLKKNLLSHPNVGDIRGKGLLWGIEFVQDKDSYHPFPRKKKIVEQVWKSLFDKGVLAYKSTGFENGDGDALMFGPPFIIEETQIEFIVDALVRTLNELFKA
jgi:adenosylmethionine-8-amino-7-oxononanoate aminotransferase